MKNIESITRAMNALESEIARQTAYIARFGEANDKNPDRNWLLYKFDYEQNLKNWDALKVKRDQIKAA